MTTQQTENPTGTASTLTERDQGLTVMDLLVLVVILGIFTSGAVFALSGMRADASGSNCGAAGRSLATAAEAFFAETSLSIIPATGTDHDRYEQTLVAGGFLRDVSMYHDLDAHGAAIPQGDSPC